MSRHIIVEALVILAIRTRVSISILGCFIDFEFSIVDKQWFHAYEVGSWCLYEGLVELQHVSDSWQYV